MILYEIAEKTILRVAEEKRNIPMKEIIHAALEKDADTGFPFEQTLAKQALSFICEVKKASPSKGVIAEDFPYVEIAREYEAAGASAVSVLTEPFFFRGRDEYLTEIAEAISLPVLRKDFTVDAYQIYQAKIMGASAILLICALLETEKLREYLAIAHGLGLSAVVEAHTEGEVESALASGAKIVGVNNRDLGTFHVDLTTSIRMRNLVPGDRLFISESGIKTPEDIKLLRKNQVDGVLIGEAFMRSKDKKRELARLRGECVD